jgi:transposase-like protein
LAFGLEVLMPWKERSVMEERLRYVARLLDGAGMSEVCRCFGISRKTGCKIFNRYKEHGLEALCDRARRPVRYANQLPEPMEQMIVRLKQDKPHRGARKIREALVRRLVGNVRSPPRVPGSAGRAGSLDCSLSPGSETKVRWAWISGGS